MRNNFYCSGCGKSLDLSQVFKQVNTGPSNVSTSGRDRGSSRYKSARKSRR